MELELIRKDGTRHVVLYDDEDHALLSYHTWRVRQVGDLFYAQTNLPRRAGRRRVLTMHRLILGLPAYDIDHINGNGLDNRRANLQPTNDGLNSANRAKRRGSSRYKGVTLHRQTGKWQASIWQASIEVQRKFQYLGLYLTEEEAARAYDAAAITAWGDHARLNFPKEVLLP